MARLRLFAGLRDLAGTGNVDIDGDTVADVLEAASDRFGSGFAGGLANARIWVNGEEADPEDPVGPGDEVALIPPVSGGTFDTRTTTTGLELLAPMVVVAALVLANLSSNPVWWPVAVVGLVTAWVVDVIEVMTARGRDFPLIPTLVAMLATLVAVWTLGGVGLGIGLAAAVVLPLGWGVASDGSRMVQILGPSILLTFVACMTIGSLVLSVGVSPAARVVGVYVAIMAVSVLTAGIIDRIQHLPVGDPFTLSSLVAIVTALIAAAVWDLDLVTFLIVGLVTAVALVAGRGLGSLLRTRQIILIERPPGLLSVLDGVILAGALYLPVLSLAS
ncbi:MAG TPA: MoaD/ThiS family protein [Acidimicrobiia bacterium]|nr:MoaD/ThiS family protein [Acidimicrobiia bacterium]